MLEVMVAYYFMVVFANGPVLHTIGPFSTEDQCQKKVQWIARHTQNASVSDCWYGPAVTVVKEPRK